MSKSKCRGFTLIELMVVIAILGIISALTTPSMMNEINQRRANLTIDETQLIVDAARTYRMQNGAWPGDSTCSDAIAIMKNSSPAYIVGVSNSNKYNPPYSTSCTSRTFSLDQNTIADWDGFVSNSLAGTEIVSPTTHQIRTTIGIPGSESALESKLSRIATGNAELNRMRTTLLLGGNDITEVRNLSANSGDFAGNINAQTLILQQLASINGSLIVQGESQFVGKARFKDELVLEKVVVENQVGCESGALARDSSGKTLSCQLGVWKGAGSSSGALTSAGQYRGTVTRTNDGASPMYVTAYGGQGTGGICPNRYDMSAAVLYGSWITVASALQTYEAGNKVTSVSFMVPGGSSYRVTSYPYGCGAGIINLTELRI